MFPEFGPVRRQQRLSDAHQFFNELLRLRTKSKFNSLLCAEQIRDDGKAASLHSLKNQRRAAPFDYAAMDLSNFEIGIDLSFDEGEIVFAAQETEEGPKI